MPAEQPIPVLDLDLSARSPAFARELLEACRSPGVFYLVHHGLSPELCSGVLRRALEFFDLPEAEKTEIHISRSPHFRGYSVMRNARDFREQLHFGIDEPAFDSGNGNPEYRRLQGPNLWPRPLGEGWRETMTRYMCEVAALGGRILAALQRALGLSGAPFAATAEAPAYSLTKLICYHPQPDLRAARVGVAPHCDWSWITILLQDSIGGLEARTADGTWAAVKPIPGALVVNIGELLEVLTDGDLPATPHRVVNVSSARPRISVPAFINPPLAARIAPDPGLRPPRCESPEREAEHVHRVLAPGRTRKPFVFGDSEWRRKGLGRWCHRPECVAG